MSAPRRGRSEPLPIDETLRRLMERLGVVEVSVWNRIRDEWVELSGTPWATQTTPIGMHGKKLVLEASSPQAVAMLRYGTTGLAHRLNAQLGEGTIGEVVVKPPSRHSG
ncbi:MAG TPA: DUF721 domain-containing protein [Acidimicrobiia bacterium]|jgi:hypothetical protein